MKVSFRAQGSAHAAGAFCFDQSKNKCYLAAEIVTTGTEILLGDIVDTNAAWIAQQLREAGVNLYYKTTVGDNEGRVRGVIEQSMARCDAIIVTGGLGPTVDDITRQAIANATGRTLVLHEGALATLKARFERFGAQLTENNIQQAYIPEGAMLIENPVGTAPGFIVETERCAVIALPGVPREMMHLMRETVLPYLRARAGATGIIRRRILRTFGIGESTIDMLLDDLMRSSNPTMGLAAHTGQCDVRIAARADDAERPRPCSTPSEAQVRSADRPSTSIRPRPARAYETVLVRQRLAGKRGVTLAVVESNTRGAWPSGWPRPSLPISRPVAPGDRVLNRCAPPMLSADGTRCGRLSDSHMMQQAGRRCCAGGIAQAGARHRPGADRHGRRQRRGLWRRKRRDVAGAGRRRSPGDDRLSALAARMTIRLCASATARCVNW